MEKKGEFITFNIKELREAIDKLWSWRVNALKDKSGYDEVVISRDDVLGVLFGDIPEKMR